MFRHTKHIIFTEIGTDDEMLCRKTPSDKRIYFMPKDVDEWNFVSLKENEDCQKLF